jgi:hypothetical protein
VTLRLELIQGELESGLEEKGQTMKRKRHTEEQIIAILREHEAGMKTADLRRKHDQRAHVLQLESQVRRPRGFRGQAPEMLES